MKPADIQVGKTYVNKGAGRTTRRVIAIGDNHRPKNWYSPSQPPNEPGVLYEQGPHRRKLYLSSFASWAGREE